jgi:large subunit ribosomal protein L10
MDNPRPEKVAVVDEVRRRLDDAAASVVTEYRGLTVSELAALRGTLTAAGGDYKIFKNTLVRRAVAGSDHQELEAFLTGPTAITFVHGDVSAVAKALRDFSRANPHLVIKGGRYEGGTLTPGDLGALADLPPRDVLLAQVAGALAAPLRQLAGLFQALPRNLAYGLSALADQRREAEPGAAPADEVTPAAEAPAEAAPGAEAPADAEPEAAAPSDAEPSADTDTGGEAVEAPSPEAG